MKSTAAILLLLLYGLALVKPALPLIDYYVQLEAYKAKCLNKTRPELHCNGQCVLMQKLKAANVSLENPITPPAPAKINFDDYPIGIVTSDQKSEFKINHATWERDFTNTLSLVSTWQSDIFHPPLT